MPTTQPVTCQIHYTLHLTQLAAFETYARTWMPLIERYGGTHHGYFLPSSNPDEVGLSASSPRSFPKRRFAGSPANRS